MIKKAALIFGIVYLVIGIAGFLPFLMSDDKIFGVFAVDLIHNIIHLLSGVLAIYASMQGAKASRMFFQIFGVVYGLVAILGFFAVSDGKLLGLFANNMADTWLHVVLALLSLYLGFGMKAEDSGSSAPAATPPATPPAEPAA